MQTDCALEKNSFHQLPMNIPLKISRVKFCYLMLMMEGLDSVNGSCNYSEKIQRFTIVEHYHFGRKTHSPFADYFMTVCVK